MDSGGGSDRLGGWYLPRSASDIFTPPRVLRCPVPGP